MWAKGVEALTQRQGRVPSSPATISINATNLSPSTASFPESISAQSEAGTEAGTWKDLLVTSGSDEAEKDKDDKPKITAVVNVPQSRYNYRPLEPPVVETPLLRDMGEATPPLEWIGLNRDRLPNLTHQVNDPQKAIVKGDWANLRLDCDRLATRGCKRSGGCLFQDSGWLSFNSGISRAIFSAFPSIFFLTVRNFVFCEIYGSSV